MAHGMNIAFFGSSLVSAYWNGAATYYRGLIHALHRRGHRITFYEPDAYGRQQHRDIPDPDWATVVVYSAQGEDDVRRCLDRAASADLIVKASGVGVFDTLLERAVAGLKRPGNLVAFWDVDAPATLDRVHADAADPFLPLIGQYDLILTYGGGDPVVSAYVALGARRCVPIYNALDPATHHPVAAESRFAATLSFLGNRMPDREARVEEFFFRPAALLPNRNFLIGGNGWNDRPLPPNVQNVGHVFTRDHNAFNCSPLAVLNINRESMARYGFSPATRVFEAAGAGACTLTDSFEGVETFFEPGREILVAGSGEEVSERVEALTEDRAKEIGGAALRRVLAAHTYDQRAANLEEALGIDRPRRPTPAATVDPRSSEDSAATEHSYMRIKSRLLAEPARKPRPLRFVIIGLSITSSWGNGHATTYRGLVRELVRRGHEVLFLEHDQPWYSKNRDLAAPPYGRTRLYSSVQELMDRFSTAVATADVVMVGSYVSQGIAVGEWVTRTAGGLTVFYDIDTPVTLARLGRDDIDYLSRDLIPRYELYLSFTGGPTLRRLEEEFGSPKALPLYCSVDPEMYYPDPQRPRWDLAYLGTYCPGRQPMLERLLLEPAQAWPRGSFAVAGSQYPESIRWPLNVARIPHVAPAEHRAFYCSQRFALNVTRPEMVRAGYSPSVRLFEAAACGVPIISDSWEGLDSFFEIGQDILVARDAAKASAILRGTDDAVRERIGQRARARVLAAHTSAHRAAELEEYVRPYVAGEAEVRAG